MSVKKFNTRIQLKHDTFTNWSSVASSFTPLAGEFIYDSDLKNFKMGDGTTTVGSLPYIIGDAKLADWATDSTTGSITASDSLNLALHRLENNIAAITGGGVVTSIDSQNGAFTTGNGISSTSNVLNVITTGYLTVGNSGVDIDSTKIDSNYTPANTTNLATVATVTAALDTLDVNAFAQAAITNGTGTSTLTINGISETDGKIATDSTTNKLDVAIDGEYHATTNKIATESTVSDAIADLDYTATGMGAGKTIATLTQTDGKIAATFQDIEITSSQISDLTDTYSASGTVAVTGTAVAAALGTLDGSHDVATAGAYNPQNGETATYKVDLFDATQTDGIVSTNNSAADTLYFKQAFSASNPIVTYDDLSGIVGAMVYKGTVNSNSDLPSSNVQEGWTYVVATEGTYAGQACEVGDMIIAKDNTPTWNIVSGENQVTNAGATLTAGAAATSIATVDGTSITLATTVTAGSATIATESNGVVTITPTVAQAANTGTIQAASGTAITLAKVATSANPADLIQPSGDIIIFDCGTATTNVNSANGAIDPNHDTNHGA